jgi:hypothetical protein
MVVGIFGILLEYPLPQLKSSGIGRSIVARAVLLLIQTFLCILYYQVCYFFVVFALRSMLIGL